MKAGGGARTGDEGLGIGLQEKRWVIKKEERRCMGAVPSSSWTRGFARCSSVQRRRREEVYMGFGWSSPKLKGAGPFTSFIFGPSVEIQGETK
jgi:hypothetical protein